MKTIGIIGTGFVGGAIMRGFTLFTDVKAYDKDPHRSCNPLEEVCKQDIVFLCLPTPMVRADGGETDLSIIRAVCNQVKPLAGSSTVFVLKSTVPVGTTQKLRKEIGISLVHNPEFLTARRADLDFITPARTVIGGDSHDIAIVAELYKERFPGTNMLLMTSDESEAVKYISNCFFAVKVIFFNEMKLGLSSFPINWDTVMEGVLTDGRIGCSHYQVPGHDGKFGFGGTCFSKDISSLIEQIKSKGFDPLMLEACWEQNKILRPDLDWQYLSSVIPENS